MGGCDAAAGAYLILRGSILLSVFGDEVDDTFHFEIELELDYIKLYNPQRWADDQKEEEE